MFVQGTGALPANAEGATDESGEGWGLATMANDSLLDASWFDSSVWEELEGAVSMAASDR